MVHAQRILIIKTAFISAAALLAFGPVLWLVGTWRDPAFASSGLAFFSVTALLFIWSATSRRRRASASGPDRVAIFLLCATAFVRLAGQVLAIDTIGAIALAIDVYAVARLMRLEDRVRAISPAWLAVAFAFSLPLERLIQRCAGYGLQEVSAKGACALLSAAYPNVTCEGVRIGVNGADVLIDLPCSGSLALLEFGFVFAIAAALSRPKWAMALGGVALTLAAALAGNVVRIALLSIGVAEGPSALGFDVMAEPWHDLVGLLAMGLAAAPVIWWARQVRPSALPIVSPRQRVDLRHSVAASFAFLAVALGIVSAPHHPIDVALGDVTISAPSRIGAFQATALPLSPREKAYFQQYGGAAVKASYGPFALLLTRTTAPLRHLHAPDECLRGMGFRVEYLGLRFAPLPTALYRATAPDGRAYRVETSFLSNHGRQASSVSEAIWIWLLDRSTIWTSVQRISPEGASPAVRARFDAGVIAALDLPTSINATQGGNHAR